MRLSIRRADGVVLAGLAVSVALNGFLALQVRRAKADQAVTVTDVQVGEEVPPLMLKDELDRAVVIDYAEDPRPTVLYVFSEACGWCGRNARNVEQLYSQGKRRFRFVGLARDEEPPREKSEVGRPGLPTYFEPAPATQEAFGFKVVPQTIVISPDGRVLKNWHGAYLGPMHAEVEGFFGVRLPGLTEAHGAAGVVARTDNTCLDASGGAYSVGAVVIVAGQTMECRAGGEWAPL